MPIFNDSEALPPFVPEGDYLVRVTELERGLSQGGKTSGCTKWNFTFAIEKAATGQPQPGRFYDFLIEHPKLNWKLDTFLKCMGIRPAKGSGFSFDSEEAAMADLLYVNPIGLRGWVYLEVNEYPVGKKKNRVGTYYTDKQKMARDEPPAAAEPPAWDRPTPPQAMVPPAPDDDDDGPF